MHHRRRKHSRAKRDLSIRRERKKKCKRKCGEGAFAFVYCLLRAEENRFCHSSCITQHDAMLADKSVHESAQSLANTEFQTSTYTIYIYIIDYSNTFITHFAPFLPSSSNLSYSATYLFLYIYIYFFFLFPIYKFYLNLREILSLISHRLSRKWKSFQTPLLYSPMILHRACVFSIHEELASEQGILDLNQASIGNCVRSGYR